MRTFLLALIVAVAATSCRGPEPPRDAAPAAQPASPPPPASPAATPRQEAGTAPAPAPSLQQRPEFTAAPADAAPSPSAQQAPAVTPQSPERATAGNAVAASPSAAAPAEAAPPRGPRYREVTLPEGTEIALTLETAVASDTSRVEDPVRASVRRAVVLDDTRVLPAGTSLRGSVTDVVRSGKVKGRARLSLRFSEIALDDERIDVRTTAVTREARSTTKKDAAKIGVPAAGGAIVGAIIGGGKGAAIGATVGGGAGTAAVMSTRGEEVRLPVGSQVLVRLSAPVTVRIRVD